MATRHEDTQNSVAAGMNPAQEFSLILKRRKGTIFFVFLIVTAVVTIGALTAPPTFQAESSLMVRIGREYIYRPEIGRSEAARMPSLAEMVNSEVEILSSHDLAEQVVEELGVELLYPDLLELEPDPMLAIEKATLRFRNAVSVRGVLESSVIKVGFQHTDPQVAADAVNLLVERFRDKHVEVFGEIRSGFLDEQLKTRQAELTRAEDELANFKKENGVFDLVEQRGLLLRRREDLTNSLRSQEIRIAELRTRSGDLDGTVEATPVPANQIPETKTDLMTLQRDLMTELRNLEFAPPDRSVQEASVRLLDLQLQENDLTRNFSEENRKVAGVREDIGLVKSFLESTEKRASTLDKTRREALQQKIDAVAAEIEVLARTQGRIEIASLEVGRERFARELAEADAMIRHLDQQERKLRQLERTLVSTESTVQTYLERVEEARIAEELDREKRINVRVIEKASRPLAPSGLSRNMKIALGSFAGVLSGAAVAVFLELFRQR